MVLFILVTLLILNELIKNKKKLCTLKDDNSCRLLWGSLKYIGENNFSMLVCFIILYFIIITMPRLVINKKLVMYDRPISNNFILITILTSLLFTIYYKGKKFYQIFGSLWCFLAVAYGLVFILKFN